MPTPTLHLHPIPEPLQDADQALQGYAKWAVHRYRRRQCGSAEGNYRPEGALAADERRDPLGKTMTQAELLAVQRAIASAPVAERGVIVALYIQPVPFGAIRKLGIRASDCPMLHRRALEHVARQLGR
jgi:hypothetical protein